MRRMKMLPTLIMLVLSVSVLVVGIYAVMPISHNVNGTIVVTASGAEVAITAYLDNSGVKDDTLMSETIITRKESTVNLIQSIEFDCENLATGEQDKVPAKKLYLEVQNNSSIALAAYFLEGTVASTGTKVTNIATTRDLSGTSGSSTIDKVVTADFSGYTQIPAGEKVKMYCILTLNKISADAITISLTNNIKLNVEQYKEGLATTKDTTKAFNFINDDNLAVKTNCAMLNAAYTSTAVASIANTNWSVNNVAFNTTKKYSNNQLRLETIKMQMLVKNSDVVPVKVSISQKNLTQTNVRATILGNDYIPAGTTQEVSVQFQSVYSRVDSSTNTSTPVTSNPSSITDYNYEVKIEKTNTASALQIYSDTTSFMYSKGFQYYMYFGNNPYYTPDNTTGLEEKLRWYIWGQEVENGYISYIQDTPTVGNGKIYYFISEYALNTSKEQSCTYISFQNEYDYSGVNNLNFYGDFANDYAGSNLRAYLNGASVRAGSYTSDYYAMPNGAYINFYDEFGFTEGSNAEIFSQIIGRSLEDLYDGNSYYDENYGTIQSTFPTNNTNVSAADEDLFWILSYNEFEDRIEDRADSSRAFAYMLSNGTGRSICNWWLRSPYSTGGNTCFINGIGNFSGALGTDRDDYCSRPAFRIKL